MPFPKLANKREGIPKNTMQKTNKEMVVEILGSGVGEMRFPKGTRVRYASNQPYGKDGKKQYFLRPHPEVKYTENQLDWINRMGVLVNHSEIA